MKNLTLSALAVFSFGQLLAQSSPAISSFMINTTGETGRHYVAGNSTPIQDQYPVNVQQVQYSQNNSYINSSGIPSYIIGPYQDGNPAQASDNDHLFKITLNPQEETGTKTNLPLGPVGVFINGVPIYDYSDDHSYSYASQRDVRRTGDKVWNRNAVYAEMDGFDCAKGHPSPIFEGGPGSALKGGTYHHHQNPTAFNLDLNVQSDVCDLYLADGLYTLDAEKHSPLIGFAFDGFPVYGSYGYANADGSGGIKLIKSSYQFRDITTRTTYADGSSVTPGPNVSSAYPIGWYKEDFEYIDGSGDLDEHNGRFCVTPEYPNGTYAYFATVDDNWNPAYPYVIGGSYYGEVLTENFNAHPPGNGNNVVINETVETYDPTTTLNETNVNDWNINVLAGHGGDLIAIQVKGIVEQDLQVALFDMQGKLVKSTVIRQGSTIWHLDTRTLYSGNYIVQIANGKHVLNKKVALHR